MDDLDNRHNIVESFYSNIGKFESTEESNFVKVYECDTLKIVHDLVKNSIVFKMKMISEYDTQEYDEGYYNYNPASGGYRTVTKKNEGFAKVIEIENDNLSMISAGETHSWLTLTKIPKMQSSTFNMSKYFEMDECITTVLNLKCPKFPITEEEHFQLSTTSDYLLDYEYFKKLNKVVEYIKCQGLFSSSQNTRVYIDFKFQ